MILFFRIIQRIEEFLLAWSIIAIAALTIANVFCRSVLELIGKVLGMKLGFSLAYAEELSQFLIVLVTFVGLSYAASRGRHIRMTAFYDQLNQRRRKHLMVVIAGSTSLLMLLLAWYSMQYIGSVRFLSSVSPVLQVPLYWVYYVVPLGLVLTAIQYGLTVAKNLASDDVYLSFEKKDEYDEPVTGEL